MKWLIFKSKRGWNPSGSSDVNFSRSCTCDVGETKTIKKRRLSLQQNCKRIAREYDERKFVFYVLETDFKKFAFTTVEATTEVLLIKQKKGASYNQTHELTCFGLLFCRFSPKSIYG